MNAICPDWPSYRPTPQFVVVIVVILASVLAAAAALA